MPPPEEGKKEGKQADTDQRKPSETYIVCLEAAAAADEERVLKRKTNTRAARNIRTW